MEERERNKFFFQPTKKPFVKQRMKLGLPFRTMRKERNSEFGTLDNVNSEESSENGGGKTEKLFLPFPALRRLKTFKRIELCEAGGLSQRGRGRRRREPRAELEGKERRERPSLGLEIDAFKKL